MSRVNIVATIGPATNNETALKALRIAGMDVARLNGSHSDLAWHEETLKLIRRTLPDVPVFLDLPGNKIRTTGVNQEIPVVPNHQVVLAPDLGVISPGKVLVNYPDLPDNVEIGDNIVMDDGSLTLVVDDIVSQDVICHAKFAGMIRNGQGVHLPRPSVRSEFLTEKDRELIAFAQRTGFDFIGLSFVETAADVISVRDVLGTGGPHIISKIETRESMNHLEETMDVSDAVLIDRGDLSVATRPETVALLQKTIINQANRSARPVIVGTEILQSMVKHSVPTKAEISDITNLVLDGATAIMLSSETAVGDFPVEAVALMRRVADSASESMYSFNETVNNEAKVDVPHVMGEAIGLICRQLEVTKIVAITISGYAARSIAANRPGQPILAVSNDPEAARRFNLLRGVKGHYVDVPFVRHNLDHIPRCIEELWRRGELVDEDLILVTAVSYPKSGNRMNLIETHLVADLKASLGWKHRGS